MLPLKPQTSYTPCVHNELDALVSRHCKPVYYPEPDVPAQALAHGLKIFKRNGISYFAMNKNIDVYMKKLRKIVEKWSEFGGKITVHTDAGQTSDMDIIDYFNIFEESLFPNLGQFRGKPVNKLSDDEITKMKAKEWLKRYDKIKDDLKRNPYNNKDKMGKMFLKFETQDIDKMHKPARCIQFRSQRYTYEMAKYLVPFEKIYFQSSKSFDENKFSFSGKGLNGFQKASILHKQWTKRKNGALCVDYSHWDASMVFIWLAIEHIFYLGQSNYDPQLIDMLLGQIDNVFVSMNGVLYKFLGRRCSGDYNTSLGNNILHFIIDSYLMRGLKTFQFVDGDDGVTIGRHEDRDEILRRYTNMPGIGLTSKPTWTDDFIQIEFCQAKPTDIGGFYSFVRNPTRVLSRLCYSIRRYTGKVMLQYYNQLALSLTSEFKGHPFFLKLANYIRYPYSSLGKLKPEIMMILTVNRYQPEATIDVSYDNWGFTKQHQEMFFGLLGSEKPYCCPEDLVHPSHFYNL